MRNVKRYGYGFLIMVALTHQRMLSIREPFKDGMLLAHKYVLANYVGLGATAARWTHLVIIPKSQSDDAFAALVPSTRIWQ
jgi:hypothetical protein